MGIETELPEEIIEFARYSNRMGRPVVLCNGQLPKITTRGALYNGYIRGFRGHKDLDGDFLESLNGSMQKMAYRYAHKHGLEEYKRRNPTPSSTFR